MMNNVFGAQLACILLAGATAQAATISWGTVTDYSSKNDVSTEGVLVEAINGCGTGLQVSPTVNGVPFVNDTSLLENDTDVSFFFGDTGDNDYDLLLNSKDAGSETSIMVGGGLLETGKTYLIQIWYLDERSSYDARAVIFGDGHGQVTGQLNDQYVIGTFTADGSSQMLTITGVGTGAQLTAYQIRDLSSAIPVISSTAGETVDGSFSVDISFSESVSGFTADDLDVVNGSASELSGFETSWTATITPISSGDVQVMLPADTVSDVDGHGNAASDIWSTTYVAAGSEQPVATLSTTTNKVYGDYTVQVEFNEPVTGLTTGDFSVTHALVTSVSGSGAHYTIVVSPNFGGDVILSLPANSVMDTDDGLQNVASDELVTAYHVDVTVSSLQELLPYLPQDNVTCVMTPGAYTIGADDISNGLFEYTTLLNGNTYNVPLLFSGNNGVYDFEGVTLYVETGLWHEHDYGTKGVYQLQVTGNNNVIKNLTMIDDGDVDDYPKDGCVNVVMDGSGNRIEGFHMTIKGSYPYGYGDSFGKGGSYTIKHHKHSALLVRGDYNHAKNCTLIHRSYGHAIFMQAATSPTIEGCYVEGEMRSTDDMLAETSGPAYDIDFLTDWGYTLPAGYMKSTGEGGIRSYNAGTTIVDGVVAQRGTSNPTVIDNTIVNMRTGVALTLSSGTKYVSGCTAIGCEQGFATGSGGIIENCAGDVQYGPIFGVAYASDKGIKADITILPYQGDQYNGGRHFARVWGSGHTLTFRGLEQSPDQELEINLGGDNRSASALEEIESYSASDVVISNLSGYPLVLDENSSGNSGQSIGTVTDNGSGNSIAVSESTVASNQVVYAAALANADALKVADYGWTFPPLFSTNDLAQTQYESSSATGGNDVATEHAQLFNGNVGNEDSDTNDSGEVTMAAGNTVTVTFDTSVNTNGYDLTGINTYFGGGTGSGGRSNQGYEIIVTTVDGAAYSLAGPSNWCSNSPAAFYWTKVAFSKADYGVLASGVKSVTFAISEDANAGGVVVAREIDVFGTPTATAKHYLPVFVYGGTTLSNGRFRTSFSGERGEAYSVEWASSLTGGWESVTTIGALESSPMMLSIPVTNDAGFYRIEWIP